MTSGRVDGEVTKDGPAVAELVAVLSMPLGMSTSCKDARSS
jgi:hypothetical protein